MNRSALLIISTFALAACGGGEKAGDGAANDSAAVGSSEAASSEMKLEPGQWEVTVETLGMEAPGMPPEAAAAMGGQKVTASNCLTAQEAERPSADLFTGQEKSNCTSNGFSTAGGRIKGSMTCTGGDDMPGTATIEMSGTYGPQSYDISQTMTSRSEGAEVRIKSRMTGRRVGECKPGADE